MALTLLGPLEGGNSCMLKALLQGRFMKHPLHPILIHLPIGFWSASLAFDIIFLIGKNPAFAIASFYSMGLGIFGALLAAAAGLAEYVDVPTDTRPRRYATLHMGLNLTVTFLYIVNLFSRASPTFTASPTITWTQFFLTLVSILILGISGYIGGMLVYQYGIGFRPEPRGKQKEAKIRRIA
jgi:uncharacterized membrane protein